MNTAFQYHLPWPSSLAMSARPSSIVLSRSACVIGFSALSFTTGTFFFLAASRFCISSRSNEYSFSISSPLAFFFFFFSWFFFVFTLLHHIVLLFCLNCCNNRF